MQDQYSSENAPSTPCGTSSGARQDTRFARWLTKRIVPVTLSVLTAIAIIIVATVSAAHILNPTEFRLPIHLPVVDLLQSFESLTIRQPTPHMGILVEFIEGANRVCREPRILYRDEDWLYSRAEGLATMLNATTRWKLGQLCEHVHWDLTAARRDLSLVDASIPSDTTLLLLVAMRLKATAEGWTSPGNLDGSKKLDPHIPPPSSAAEQKEALAALREWVGHLAPEVSSTLNTAAFEAQISILNSITSVQAGLSTFITRLRRAVQSIDQHILPLFTPDVVNETGLRLLEPLKRGSKERGALEPSVQEIEFHVCQLGNALQAVEDMTMALLVIIITADPSIATAAVTNRHRFSNSSALDGWNKTIQHLPNAVLSAAYSSRRACTRRGDEDGGIYNENARNRYTGLVQMQDRMTDRATGEPAARSAAVTTRRRVVVPPQSSFPSRRSMLEGLAQKFRFRFSYPDAEEVSQALTQAIDGLQKRRLQLYNALQDDIDQQNAKLEQDERVREHRVQEFYKALDSIDSAADVGNEGRGVDWLNGLWTYVGLGKGSDEDAAGSDTRDTSAGGPGLGSKSTVELEARRFARKFGWAWRAFSADMRNEIRRGVRDADMLNNILLRKQIELLRISRGDAQP
ncbi:hypothetical protein ColLi_12982 [Colletotrichum liriopes]|uniref:Uncharacterized protein n=1 Tax=Colletotrichum liriopes TaxID=708192 RepID=A0AA37LZ94_9PEZI|nr:hypothetical protein ColLi_12982 [Colletotrichum liriopes]